MEEDERRWEKIIYYNGLIRYTSKDKEYIIPVVCKDKLTKMSR